MTWKANVQQMPEYHFNEENVESCTTLISISWKTKEDMEGSNFEDVTYKK